jgi:hypothetical protein
MFRPQKRRLHNPRKDPTLPTGHQLPPPEEARPLLTLRAALRQAGPIELTPKTIDACLDPDKDADALVSYARSEGLSAIDRSRRYVLNSVTGEVAESVAELLLAEVGFHVFWHITTSGVHGVDLLLLSPDESVLALEVKGTLRAGTIPRLTPSRLRQMSREWLNGPDNPAMAEWEFEADDLYAGVMVVDLATPVARLAVSADFETYLPVAALSDLRDLGSVLTMS